MSSECEKCGEHALECGRENFDSCQYCFLHYDTCTCCKYCSFPNGTCFCHLEGENPCTKFHPSDVYKMLGSKNCVFTTLIPLTSLHAADEFIMRMFVEEVWPERLKNI